LLVRYCLSTLAALRHVCQIINWSFSFQQMNYSWRFNILLHKFLLFGKKVKFFNNFKNNIISLKVTKVVGYICLHLVCTLIQSTIPDWYDFRWRQPCVCTSLVGTWGYQLCISLYNFQYQVYISCGCVYCFRHVFHVSLNFSSTFV